MNDWEMAKRELEREHIGHFLWSYRKATGEELTLIAESETPDFIFRDDDGSSVGIELTQVRFSPSERSYRHRRVPAIACGLYPPMLRKRGAAWLETVTWCRR